jgi:hypothetical protein
MENDPRVLEIFNFAKTQILAQSLDQHYMEEYAHPSDQQIQDYYNTNIKKYTEVTLQRITIPLTPAPGGKSDAAKPTADEQKAYALKIRERWVAGEDPAKLEKEVYEHAGYTTTSPDVNLGARRPGSLPPTHDAVFELKANEISQPFNDPAVYYIYKAVSVRTVPLSEVKSTIETTLQRQMYTDKIKEVRESATAVLNEAYFGPDVPEQPMRPGMPGGMRPGGPPMGPGGRPMPPQPPAGAASSSAPPAAPQQH